MSYRLDEFAPGEIYHIYTRGVERRILFRQDKDRQRLLDLLVHCLPQGNVISFSTAQKLGQPLLLTQSGEGLVNIVCYCLMSNHIHLLLKENVEKGISAYMQRLLTSYAMYFNKSMERSGSLFTNPFRAVLVDGDDYFLHVSRYIHLNPYVARLVAKPTQTYWSSLAEYLPEHINGICHTDLILSSMSRSEYQSFVSDHADYAQSLADIDYVLIDGDDKAN